MGDLSNRSVRIGGSSTNSTVNTGTARDIQLVSDSTNGLDADKQQLSADLRELQARLAAVERDRPELTETEATTLLDITTPKPVKERLVKALVSSGQAAIAEFLNNAYVNIVMAAIEGWRS